MIALLVGACTRTTSNEPPAGSNAPDPGAPVVAIDAAPQISVDATDPVVAVDAAPALDAGKSEPDKPDTKHDGKPDAKPDTKLVQCGADSDCVLTMIPAEPACCRELCVPRAVAKSTLPGLEAKQAARDCKAVLCAPPAPCPRPKQTRPVCERGACVAR